MTIVRISDACESRKKEYGNVIEAERQQLLTRDIYVSSVSLLIINLLTKLIMSVVFGNVLKSIIIFGVPELYLAVMYVLSRRAANNTAKGDVICMEEKQLNILG